MTISHKIKSSWEREIIQDGEKYGAPEGTMRQIKKPNPFSSYIDLRCDIIDKEPTFFEKSIQNKEWPDAITKEYQSIIKNDVWEIFPRTKSKDMVCYKWIYNIKHVGHRIIEKYKTSFVSHGSSQKRGNDYVETFSCS
jgi:hypothetical protein